MKAEKNYFVNSVYDTDIHLYSIRDNALDAFVYPLLCTFSDLKKFLSSRLECVPDESFPQFFQYPNQYGVFDCGTYKPVLPDGSNNPYNTYPRPRFLGRVSDFRYEGDVSDGKSPSSDKDI